MASPQSKHWSRVEYLAATVTNPNIHVRGPHSYYSDAWTGSFEDSVVRYLYGDAFSRAHWEPQWAIDQLCIGDYVCIGAEAVILMGGNHTHRMDWFSLYPFADVIADAYVGKGDTVIGDGAWIGLRAMLMPGVTIGEGARCLRRDRHQGRSGARHRRRQSGRPNSHAVCGRRSRQTRRAARLSVG